MKRKKKTTCLLLMVLIFSAGFATAQDTLYIYKSGIITYKSAVAQIDSITFSEPTVALKLDTFIVNNYSHDARALYFNEIVSNPDHADYYNPRLDSISINKNLEVIQAVYNLKSTETDTVFDIYKIHNYCYTFNSIGLKVQTDLPEIINLSKGIIPTGNVRLDSVLSVYHFNKVEPALYYPSPPWLLLYSDHYYNMIPIEKEFARLPQIIVTETGIGNEECIGDAYHIILTRAADSSSIITFIKGFGDCPAGCFYHRNWEFKVKNGIASFIRSYKD